MPGTVSIRFLTSNALSLLGNSIASVALPLILLATTGDALAAGALALICAIPQMIIGILGGALLDHFNRRDISILSDLVSAGSVALIPVVDMVWGLNFWWFVVLGLLGAIGDIPGMTARDALIPAVAKYDHADLQRFMGLSQSLDSLTTIVGPAAAAVLIGTIGGVPALWVTAACSFCAALATTTVPRTVGSVRVSEAGQNTSPAISYTQSTTTTNNSLTKKRGIIRSAGATLRTGIRVLFGSDKILRTSTLLSFGIVMVMGSFQGLVLPVYFTLNEQPELLGYVLSVMSFGLLVSSLAYSALAPRFSKRAWYSTSLVGMIIGVGIIGLLPAYPLLLVGSLILGASAGPASALLGFFMLDRIPETSRGSALGTQNSLLLIATPIAIFATSVAVDALSINAAAIMLVSCWTIITIGALGAKSMRVLDGKKSASTTQANCIESPCSPNR